MQAISFEDVETKHILNHYSSNFPIKALKKKKKYPIAQTRGQTSILVLALQ